MVRLLPKQECFFDLFEKQVGIIETGAKTLADLMNDFRNVEDVAFSIKATEHDGDEVAHEIMKKLNMTFVTPLDREDIHSLASALDDILDYIEAASDRMVLYEIKEPTESATKLATILADATHLIVGAVGQLRNMRNSESIREACVAINRLENQGDQANRAALAKLFQMHDKPIEALKWREVYNNIESAIDKCEDVADILEAIVLKSA